MSSITGEIDLGLGILDHQLVDRDGRRCGKVDDLELEGIRDRSPRVAAVIVGVPGWRRRGVIARIAASLAPGRIVRIPWSDVDEVAAGIHLRRSAAELRLGRGDDRARALVDRIPKAR
jgi:sporulation protein YlmC with PRC-barrel domain